MLPTYDVLTADQVHKIHDAALTVLAETGMAISHPLASAKLAEAGAKVDFARGRVYFPPNLVETMRARIPSQFTCGARDPQFDLTMQANQDIPHLRTDSGPIYLFDLLTERNAPLRMQDMADACTLADFLEDVDVVSGMTPMDVPSPIQDIAVAKLLLEKSRKHSWALASSSINLRYELEMMEVVAGTKKMLKERPLGSGMVCVIAPLRIPCDEIDRLLLYGEYGIPVRVHLAPLVGGNAPYTLAGALTQINAEFLGAATVIQLLCPGLPLWYYPLIMLVDNATGRSLGDGPEALLLFAACAQMARYYNAPANLTNMSFGSVQSHQMMYHLGTFQFFGSFLGAAEQAGGGSVQNAVGYSHQALVLCAESMRYAKRFRAGLDMSDASIAMNDIKQMAMQGVFSTSPISQKQAESEPRFQPLVWEWCDMNDWLRQPTTIVERADALVKRILSEHEVPPLSDDAQVELERIYHHAEEQILKK